MRALNLPFHSYTFRLTVMYLVLFLISFLIVFSFIFLSTQRDLTQQLEAELRTDAQAFADRYALFGINGVIRLMSNRVQAEKTASLYILRDINGQVLAGTLDRWPLIASQEKSKNRQYALIQVSDDHSRKEYLTRYLTLPFDGDLLIGKPTLPLKIASHKLIRIFLIGGLITLALGLAGGVVLSKRAVKRIERINRLCRSIIDGDFSSRIQANQNGDDLDQLSCNINEMLDRIESLMSEITEVSDNIAHDLRTPLSHLRNRLESAAAKITDSSANTEIEQAINATDSLLETFNALLRIAKIESGQKKVAFETIDLHTIAADVVEMYEPLAEEKQQTLVMGVPPTSVNKTSTMRGDKNLLFQAISNLVDNAIKYTPEHGKIRVTVTPNGDSVQVCDNGPGIPAHELANITKRFYRLERSRTTSGNGLGLSLVKAIAELHHGSLQFDNQTEGLCVLCVLMQVK